MNISNKDTTLIINELQKYMKVGDSSFNLYTTNQALTILLRKTYPWLNVLTIDIRFISVYNRDLLNSILIVPSDEETDMYKDYFKAIIKY